MPKYRLQKGDAAIVYNIATGRVREIHLANFDGEHVHPVPGPGTALHRRVPKRYQPSGSPQAVVTALTGLTPPSDRCVVFNVKSQKIVGAIHAESGFDDPPDGCVLIQHDQAGPGWTYDPHAGTFSPPPSAYPAPSQSEMVTITKYHDRTAQTTWSAAEASTLARFGIDVRVSV